jgi:gamma-glutamyltranspeptidase/glutathione hydrolase
MGHHVYSINGAPVGGFQSILVTRTGPTSRFYRAGSDHREDGQAAGW